MQQERPVNETYHESIEKEDWRVQDDHAFNAFILYIKYVFIYLRQSHFIYLFISEDSVSKLPQRTHDEQWEKSKRNCGSKNRVDRFLAHYDFAYLSVPHGSMKLVALWSDWAQDCSLAEDLPARLNVRTCNHESIPSVYPTKRSTT